MKRFPTTVALLLLPAAAFSQDQKPARPSITGIGSVTIDVQNPSEGLDFYVKELGFSVGPAVCQGGNKLCVGVNAHQRIDLHMPSAATDGDFLEEVTFQTSNIEQLRRYLLANGIAAGEIRDVGTANRRFSLNDPEGHHIGFIQYLAEAPSSNPENQVSSRIIHAGLVVRDRPAEDHFYKDVLGFRPYWHGGMKEDETNWASIQVPDGTDWIEYMLRIPADADQRLLGVMNHIALGVTDIHSAQQQLLKNGWKPGEQPKIGRDGKWQLNLYDPDLTRIEFMEFKPVQKPCCSDFTGPHPSPK